MMTARSLAPAVLLGLLVLAGSRPGHAQIEAASVVVDGMSCPFCAFGVEKRLKKVEGVELVDIDMDTGLSSMRAAAGGSIDVAAIPRAVRKAGFTAGRVEVTALGTIHRKSDHWVLEIDGSRQELRVETAESELQGHLEEAAEAGSRIRVTGAVEAEAEPMPILRPETIATTETGG